ncbi:MAG: hypothetical protein Q9169_006088 [Polycauliona sp. 2 TL-2023]
MPHATSAVDIQDVQDDLLIQQVLDPENTSFDVTRELEPGDKADDAVDYGDLSDDDLADDEELSKSNQYAMRQDDPVDEIPNGSTQENMQQLTGSDDGLPDNFDDLFGELPQSPTDRGPILDDQSDRSPQAHERPFVPAQNADDRDEYHQRPLFQSPNDWQMVENDEPPLQALDAQAMSKDEKMQQYLISLSTQGNGTQDSLPGLVDNQAPSRDLASLWPKFERDSVPRFMDLLPLKRSYYVGKTPLKQPRPVHPTKLNLDIAVDQEKQFRLSSGTSRRFEDEECHGIIKVLPPKVSEQEGANDSPLHSESDDGPVGGVTWQDLQIICEDWDSQSLIGSSVAGSTASHDDLSPQLDKNGHPDFANEDLWELPVAKRRKTDHGYGRLLRTHQFSLPALHDPSITTSKIAQSVTLNLNDQKLLVENTRTVDGARQSTRPDPKTKISLSQRYNISNDEAYDLLKENHQSKIRSNLGNPQIEHSLPAVRLQWPYYKTSLEKQEARSFHRPVMSFHKNEKILFSKPRFVKRKHLKGKDTHSLFGTTQELSLGDNSSVLLLEYSEEFPTIMSNFGMGSRIINYYRRKSPEDSSRPKLEIGETNLLMPQDKSPFSMFGHIDPGEISPALYNGMYKAPLFTQQPKNNDFVVVRNTTGVHGPYWYIRTIEHIRVVGQEFPSVDVPGPHSRKVTTAAKNRLKMISYRLLRRSKTHKIKVSAVTKHFADSTDMQNRQKMKEFMQFDKTGKEWEMRAGEAIPDEESIRTMVKPEDVCLLESMQVGQQHLQDAGFGKGDDDAEGDAANQGRVTEQLLAPWFTTRNFQNAVQGKAMLELHGEGDPSGRGEAFSFIKTSMKGGFKAMGESVEDRLDAKKMKELGGHSYNVARQQKSYEESIRRIWESQKQSLSSTQEHSDAEKDEGDVDDEEEPPNEVRTPRSEAQTPASFRRKDDDTMSQFSKMSSSSQAGRVLKITRKIPIGNGAFDEKSETVRDARIIRQYQRRKKAQGLANINLNDAKPTGNAELDRIAEQAVAEELARLERNKDRRLARDKQKGGRDGDAADIPGSPASVVRPPGKSAGTQRKCANCGQVGHIKTNKNIPPPMRLLFAAVAALSVATVNGQSSSATSAAASPAGSSAAVVPGTSTYTYFGCYNETTGDSATGNRRALADGSMVLSLHSIVLITHSGKG